jgi:hypothetical protein
MTTTYGRMRGKEAAATSLTIRVPNDFHRQLEQSAQESCRSLSGQIVYLLRPLLKTDLREESAT